MIRTDLYQVGVKIETEKGVKVALAAADFITAHNAKFTPDLKMAKMDGKKGTMSKSLNRPGLRSAKISYDAYLRGGTGLGVAPELGVSLKLGGAKETIVATTSVTYTPAPLTTVMPTATVELRRDGKIYRIWGAVCEVKLKGVDGEGVLFSFEYTGCDFEVVDGGLMAGVSYTTLAEVMFQGINITLDGANDNLNLTSINMAFGNRVALRKAVAESAPSGYRTAYITDRNPTMSFDPEEVLNSEIDFYGTWQAGTPAAVVIGPMACGAGQACTISASKLQYQSVSEQDREGVGAVMINGELKGNSGDDEWSIVFAASV